ncbi:hypothetical protein V7161_26095 [Neobacillus drentensis]
MLDSVIKKSQRLDLLALFMSYVGLGLIISTIGIGLFVDALSYLYLLYMPI